MGILNSVSLMDAILSGTITGSQLETALTTSGSDEIGAFQYILNTRFVKNILSSATAFAIIVQSAKALELMFANPYAVEYLADSENAVALMMASSSALTKFVDSQLAISAFNKTSTRRARINSYINKTGFKLKRVYLTASGTLTYTGTVVKMALFMVGSGGNGASVTSTNYNGYGGGGGQIVNQVLTSGFPASGSSVTIANATTTSIASFGTTALSAVNATNSVNSPGAGTTTGDDISSYITGVINTDILNNFWSYGNFTLKGGDGEGSGLSASVANASFGSIGNKSKYDGDGADAGIGISAGGRQGGGTTYSEAGEAALPSSYGSGGGGGVANISTSGSSGGNGATGLVCVHIIVS